MVGRRLVVSAMPEPQMSPLEDEDEVTIEEDAVPLRSFGRGRIDPSNFQQRRHPGGRGNPLRVREEAARVGAVNTEMQR